MTMVSIGDLARGLLLQKSIASTKSRLDVLTGSLASGNQPDVAKAVRGDMSHLVAIEGALARIGGWRSAGQSLAQQAGTMQSALGALSGIGQSVSETLNQVVIGEQGTRTGVATAEALEAFEAAVGIVNAQVADQFVFSGTGQDRPPLPDARQILDHLVVAAAGAATAAEVADRVDAWFDDPVGYAGVAYRGGAPGGPVAVGPGTGVALGVTAMDPAIRSLLKGLALAALPERGVLDTDLRERQALASRGGDTLRQTEQDRIALAARIGIAQQTLNEAAVRNASEETALGIARSGLVAADPFASAAELEATRVQLETLYALTVRLSGLSLVEALR